MCLAVVGHAPGLKTPTATGRVCAVAVGVFRPAHEAHSLAPFHVTSRHDAHAPHQLLWSLQTPCFAWAAGVFGHPGKRHGLDGRCPRQYPCRFVASFGHHAARHSFGFIAGASFR